MRSLEIILYADKVAPLPLAYNSFLQGALYSCWKDSFAALHDNGYAEGSTNFRLFTFSPLRGKNHIQDKKITFSGAFSFEVRTLEEDLLDSLAANLANQGCMRIGWDTFPLVNLVSRDRLIFPEKALIKAVAPISVHRSTEDGHSVYPDPFSSEFYDLVQLNLSRKVAAAGYDINAEIALTPDPETLKKRVTTFKGIHITGWEGTFLMEANPQVMAMAYHLGLGSRNSQGFGMFDIIDRPVG